MGIPLRAFTATLVALLFISHSISGSPPNPARRSGVTDVYPSAEHPSGQSLALSPLSPALGLEVRMNRDEGSQSQNEPTIALNPLDRKNLIGGANDYRTGDAKAGYYVTHDGGLTWRDGILPGIPAGQIGGDPAVAFGHQGHAYYSFISFSRSAPCAGGGLYVSRSTDGGTTWNLPVTTVANQPNRFNDREYIAVDRWETSPHRGTIYMSWVQFLFPSYDTTCRGSITLTSSAMMARSTDGGITWSTPLTVSEAAHLYNQAANPFVAPNGNLYIAWTNYDLNTPQARRILIARSTDGGGSFAPIRTVAEIVGVPSPFPGSRFRVDTYPVGGVDPAGGTLYVVWNDYRSGDGDILLSRSTDGGEHWSMPSRVNDDPTGNGRDQFFPWLAVSPDGTVNVSWFDRREDPANLLYHIYVAHSVDGGLSFNPNRRVTTVPSNPAYGFGGGFIGDYMGLAAVDDALYPAWTDTRRGQQDVYAIYPLQNRRIRPIATPSPPPHLHYLPLIRLD